MSKPSLKIISSALHKSWCAKTSSSKEWTTDNPSLGQCAVTACVIQDYLGGEVVNCIATLPNGNEVSHYLNLIDDKYVDLTIGQFAKSTTFSEPVSKIGNHSSTREYCLSYIDTKNRYEILKARVAEFIHHNALD